MVSVLASVDGGQLTSDVEKLGPVNQELSCERTQVKSYFTHLNKVLPKKTISV